MRDATRFVERAMCADARCSFERSVAIQTCLLNYFWIFESRLIISESLNINKSRVRKIFSSATKIFWGAEMSETESE